MNIEDIAEVAHEVNRTYCMTIGDPSQVPWTEAPLWQRQSAINGVKFHIANPHTTPAQSHESWLREKVADGWIYGEKKDVSLKQHPCILPYDQLPKDQQTKDYLFSTVVRKLYKFLKTE